MLSSVRLSVVRVDQSKTVDLVEVTIVQFFIVQQPHPSNV